MKKFVSILLLALAPLTAAAQPADLFKGLLDSMPENPEVVIRRLTLNPGYDAALPHRHDAYLYLYVVEGMMEMQLEGREAKRFSAGEVFAEKPGDVHIMTRNPSSTEPTRLVAFLIRAEGAPFAVPVDP